MAYARDPQTRREQVIRDLDKIEKQLAAALAALPAMRSAVQDMKALAEGRAEPQPEAEGPAEE